MSKSNIYRTPLCLLLGSFIFTFPLFAQGQGILQKSPTENTSASSISTHDSIDKRISDERSENTGVFERHEAFLINGVMGGVEFIIGGAGTVYTASSLRKNSKIFYDLSALHEARNYERGTAGERIPKLQFGLTKEEAETIARRYTATIKPPLSRTIISYVSEAVTRKPVSDKKIFTAGKILQIETNSTKVTGIHGIDPELRTLIYHSGKTLSPEEIFPKYVVRSLEGLSRDDIKNWRSGGEFRLHKLVGEQDPLAYAYLKGLEDARRGRELFVERYSSVAEKEAHRAGYNLVHDRSAFNISFRHQKAIDRIDGSKFTFEELSREIADKTKDRATFIQARSYSKGLGKWAGFASLALFAHSILDLLAVSTDVANVKEDPHGDFCRKYCDGRGLQIKASTAGIIEFANAAAGFHEKENKSAEEPANITPAE